MGKSLGIQTYENVLSSYEIEYIQNCLDSSNWKFGQRSNPSSDKKFWYMDLSDDDFYTKFFLDRIKTLTSLNFKLCRVYANGKTFGLDSEWHTDGTEDDIYTFLYYSNESWDPSWGGETMFAIENNILQFTPKANTALFFPATLVHYGKSPSRDFYGLRTTIAFKLRIL
jgi:hypothetical protein